MKKKGMRKICIEVSEEVAEWLERFTSKTIFKTPENFILNTIQGYHTAWRLATEECQCQ